MFGRPLLNQPVFMYIMYIKLNLPVLCQVFGILHYSSVSSVVRYVIDELHVTILLLVEAMKRVETIRQRRQGQYMMQRLRKGRELETQRDIKEVQRDLALIRSPAAGLKERRAMEESIVEEIHESDVEMEREAE